MARLSFSEKTNTVTSVRDTTTLLISAKGYDYLWNLRRGKNTLSKGTGNLRELYEAVNFDNEEYIFFKDRI